MVQKTKDRLTNNDLRQVVDACPAIIYTRDVQGDFQATFMSESITEQLGYEPQEFLNNVQFWNDHIHPDDISRVLKEFPSVLKNGHLSHKYRFRHKDGTYCLVRDDMKFISDADGTPEKIVGTLLDFTRQDLIDEAFLASNERFRRFFNMPFTGAGITAISDKSWIEVNDTLCRLMGYSREEMLELTWADLTHPDDIDENTRLFNETISGENLKSYGMEKRYIRKDGSTLYAILYSECVRQPDGTPSYMVISVEDITERKQFEMALLQSEENIKQERNWLIDAINAFKDGFALYDADDKLVICNENFLKAHEDLRNILKPGITYEECVRTRARLSQHRDGIIRDEEWIQKRLHQHRNPTEPFERSFADGTTFQIHEFKTRNGGTAVARFDITNQKKANNSLAQNEIKLKAALSKADEANQAKSIFLAAASHDVRQPLQSMGMFLSVLEDKLSKTPVGKEKTVQALVDRMNDSVSVLTGLFDSLLEISKLESQTLEPIITEFNVAELVARLAGQFESRARDKGLDFKVVSGDFKIQCDKTLVSQILSNFLSNAIRYTDTGEILFGVYRQGRQISIEVKDAGIGISETNINHIFNEFFQVGNKQRDRTKGLGLGLAIAKRTADLMALPLTVSSKEGKGSKFAIQVPLANDHSDTSKQVADGASNKPGNSATKTILVIDDDPIVLESLKFRLEAWNHVALAALSLEEAQELLLQNDTHPDIIISDLRLSETMDGVQAIKVLRAGLKNDVTGIILTGDTSPDRLAYIEQDGLTVVHKPVHSDMLAALLNEPFS
ncbi:MAG: PAS domain-containing protein [Rhodospirillaceae bacterium]|jgi:PAS domain S-box-containing protein|nr:PAS domain-containing protein [Rhodospirillales bacterium]MBT3905992.1 PAS domain-containing protein [Rhodospirillaceae bacterium]MBT4703648.1 PAS domain-containing protein [Rhodospirillaceae bacterium]MBT5036012.1 PAS domain-containing protein [Rhodospirillaceae bacterium]MBT6220604.1 PAS domain-containing protein [Rhodospirillaceae bacterium]